MASRRTSNNPVRPPTNDVMGMMRQMLSQMSPEQIQALQAMAPQIKSDMNPIDVAKLASSRLQQAQTQPTQPRAAGDGFDWQKIVQQQPAIANALKSGNPPATAGKTVTTAGGHTIDTANYPPNLPLPSSYNPEWPIVVLHFFITTWDLLNAVAATFPECEQTPELLEMLKNKVHPDPRTAKFIVRSYHRAMNQYFEDVEKKDTSFLSKAEDIPFFYELDMCGKINDPDLPAESKKNLLLYIDRLNALSDLFVTVPEAIFNTIYSSAYEEVDNNGPAARGEMDQQESLKMGMELLSKLPSKEVMSLFSDKEKIRRVALNFKKLSNVQGMENFSKITDTILSLLFDQPTDLI